MAKLVSPGNEEQSPARVSEGSCEGTPIFVCDSCGGLSLKKFDAVSVAFCRYARFPDDWGNFAAFVDLIEGPAIAVAVSVCTANGLAAQDGEDFFRLALLKAIEHRDELECNWNVKGWFLATMCNEIRAAVRKKARERLTAFDKDDDDERHAAAYREPAAPYEEQPERSALWNEQADLLAMLLPQLTPIQQDAWRLRTECLTLKEMATLWGVSESAARSRVRDARMAMFHLISRYYPELRRFWEGTKKQSQESP